MIVGSQVQAATLDFSGFAGGDTGLASLDVGDATANISGGTAFVFRPGDYGYFPTYGGMCGLSGVFECETDWALDFDFGVTNIVFSAAGVETGDLVQVEAFSGATSVGNINISAAGTYSGLSGIASITRLVFDDSSTSAGIGFGEFSYDRANAVSTVPLPGAIWMFLAALGALGVFRSRGRSASAPL